MLILALLSVLALASAQSDNKCNVHADLAVLIDPTGDAKTFETAKRAAMDAVLALNLTRSRIGVWQMSQPPKLEVAMGPVNKEMFVKKIMEIKQQKAMSLKGTAAGAISASAKALKEIAPLQIQGQDMPKTILYVAGSPCGKAAQVAATKARADRIGVLAIAVGMHKKDVEDLYALTGGGTAKTLEIALDAKDTDTDTKVKDWLCSSKKDSLGGQDFCVFLRWFCE